MEPIRSPRNRAVVDAGRLHRARERKERGQTLLEGPHLLRVALAADVEIEQVFALADDDELDRWPQPTLVTDAVMAKLAGTRTPRGPVAVISIPDWVPPSADQHLLVLIGVGDPGNLGTIIRSAAAFGLGVVIAPGAADPWSPKVLRAGAGAHFRTRLSRIEGVGELGNHRLAATVVTGGLPPSRLGPGPWAFLIGPESAGLAPDVVAAAAATVTVPMPGGTESLNAAVAASIIAYEVKTGSYRGSGDH